MGKNDLAFVAVKFDKAVDHIKLKRVNVLFIILFA